MQGKQNLILSVERQITEPHQFKPLELPGRGERLIEDALDSIEDMVDDLANQIVKEEPETFILLGYSLELF